MTSMTSTMSTMSMTSMVDIIDDGISHLMSAGFRFSYDYHTGVRKWDKYRQLESSMLPWYDTQRHDTW